MTVLPSWAAQSASGHGPTAQTAVGFFDGVDAASRPVMAAARQRIEQIRKGDFTVKLIDETGQPVAGTAHVKLVRHAFDFGACIWTLVERARTSPAAQKALEAVDELFNTVTVCGYWKNNEARRGELDWSRTDSAMAWAQDHDKKMRFHCVIYSFPGWLSQISTATEWWDVFEARIRAVAERYGKRIKEYDVINEMVSDKVAANFAAMRRQIEGYRNFPLIWEPANGARLLSIARKYLPDARLVVLETRPSTVENPEWQAVVQYDRDLAKLNAPFDLAGYQGHFFPGGTMPMRKGHPTAGPDAYTMRKLEAGLDLLAEVGKPVVVTEFNPPSRDGKRKDVARQDPLTQEELAAWTVNYYTLIYSKPYTRGLTRWFVLDGGRGVDAGILDQKGEKKAVYEALRKLLKETWHTDWSGPVTDGRIAYRGFYGTYEVQVDGYVTTTFSCNSPEERSATAVMVKHNGE